MLRIAASRGLRLHPSREFLRYASKRSDSAADGDDSAAGRPLMPRTGASAKRATVKGAKTGASAKRATVKGARTRASAKRATVEAAERLHDAAHETEPVRQQSLYDDANALDTISEQENEGSFEAVTSLEVVDEFWETSESAHSGGDGGTQWARVEELDNELDPAGPDEEHRSAAHERSIARVDDFMRDFVPIPAKSFDAEWDEDIHGPADVEIPEPVDGTFTSQQISTVLEGRRARDITVLDVGDYCSFAKQIIIASALTPQHKKNLVWDVRRMYKKHKIPATLYGVDTDWTLLDCHDKIVHILTEEAREFFQLEQLWASDREFLARRTGDDREPFTPIPRQGKPARPRPPPGTPQGTKPEPEVTAKDSTSARNPRSGSKSRAPASAPDSQGESIAGFGETPSDTVVAPQGQQ